VSPLSSKQSIWTSPTAYAQCKNDKRGVMFLIKTLLVHVSLRNAEWRTVTVNIERYTVVPQKISVQWVTSSSARFAVNPTKWSNNSYSKIFHSNLQDSVSGQNYFSFLGHHLAHPLTWPWNRPIRLLETKMHTKFALKNPRAREPWGPLDVDSSIVLNGTIKNMSLICKLGWILSLQGRFV
jgi:hypothetical protein